MPIDQPPLGSRDSAAAHRRPDDQDTRADSSQAADGSAARAGGPSSAARMDPGRRGAHSRRLTPSDDELRIRYLQNIWSEVSNILEADAKRFATIHAQKTALFCLAVAVIVLAITGAALGLYLSLEEHIDLGGSSTALSVLVGAALIPVFRVWKKLTEDEVSIRNEQTERRRFASIVLLAMDPSMSSQHREKIAGELSAKFIELMRLRDKPTATEMKRRLPRPRFKGRDGREKDQNE